MPDIETILTYWLCGFAALGAIALILAILGIPIFGGKGKTSLLLRLLLAAVLSLGLGWGLHSVYQKSADPNVASEPALEVEQSEGDETVSQDEADSSAQDQDQESNPVTPYDMAVMEIKEVPTRISVEGHDGTLHENITIVVNVDERTDYYAKREMKHPVSTLIVTTEMGPASVFLRDRLMWQRIIPKIDIYYYLTNGYTYRAEYRDVTIIRTQTKKYGSRYVDEFEFRYEAIEWSSYWGDGEDLWNFGEKLKEVPRTTSSD